VPLIRRYLALGVITTFEGEQSPGGRFRLPPSPRYNPRKLKLLKF